MGDLTHTRAMESLRFFPPTHEPDARFAVGWEPPEDDDPAWFWFALVERGTDRVLDGGGANGELPTLDDLVQATRGYTNWVEHREIYAQLREAELSVRPPLVRDLLLQFVA